MHEFVAVYGTGSSLLLNTGNAFKQDGTLERKRAELIFQAYDLIGYDVYALGPQDLVFGLPELLAMAQGKKFQLICSNLAGEGAAEVATHALVEKAGQKILLTSIIDPELAAPENRKNGFTLSLSEPDPVLSRLFASIPHDLSVLVVQSTMPRLEVLLKNLSVKPDLVVLGYQFGIFTPQILPAGGILVGNNYDGKALCAIDLTPSAAGWQQVAWQHEALYFESLVPEPQVDALIVEQEDWEKAYLKQQNATLRPTANPATMNVALGADWCKRCHQQIYEKWQGTRHASAIMTLKKQDRLDDPRCLVCHVTLMADAAAGQPADVRGGFVSMQITPHLANVQCEACHGPGMLHTRQPEKIPMQSAGVEVCQRCHTPESSPDFDYAPQRVH